VFIFERRLQILFLFVDRSSLLLNFGCGDPMNWIQLSKNFCDRFPTAGRYLIGVSGGRDSVALLHQLVDLGYKNLVVCHLNHRLRGRSSDADARFVERLVTTYDRKVVGQALRLPDPRAGKRSARPTTQMAHVNFELGTTNVRALAKKKRMSIESAGRDARYSFFVKVAKRRKCDTIFLAHHADDLVETFLLNLLRGAGTTGLAAMREVSARRIGNVDLTIVRPLLAVWRCEIDKYVRQSRLKFREDASNKDLGPIRNRIRRRVIPYLEKTFGRNLRRNIWRTAMILAEEENFFESFLPKPDAIDVRAIRELPPAMQRRLLLKWLRSENIRDVGFDLIERARTLLDQTNQVAKTNLPGDRYLRRRAGKLFIEP
jgi:tRNA(Ile)-lysidine synthase